MKVVALRIRRPEDGEVETIARVFVPEGSREAVVESTKPDEQEWVKTLLSRGGVVDAKGRSCRWPTASAMSTRCRPRSEGHVSGRKS